jgi:GNAT superfamily N-acetyltransferase|tara:strand:- start:151 stop:549 length:399 start_codon:yes stop_codon:yes gene_type:complete
MRKIIETEIGSDFSKQLYSMLVGEWNDMEAFESTKFGLSIPNPMVVVEHNQVIGGAAFTRYQKPDSNDVVIWLNALYIRPESRGQGIATDLIYALHGIAKGLHALTDVADLYIKAGWNIVKEDENGTIVKQL